MTHPKVFTIRCPVPGCADYIVLPRRSLLGQFDDLPSPSKGEWPINYLCKRCGRVSVHPAEAIRPQDGEEQIRNQHMIVRYDFSNGQPRRLRRLTIYAKEPQSYTPDRDTLEKAVERILKPSALWKTSYGSANYALVDTFGQEQVNLTRKK